MLRPFVPVLFALLALVAPPSIAQPDIVKVPVQFAEGKTGTSIQGSVQGNQTIDDTLRAASGQTMTVMLSGGSPVHHHVLLQGMIEASAHASEGEFNATGQIPCAWPRSQPMGQCDFGVVRAGGGTAAVAITRPDGRKRVIFFKGGTAVGADTSQADGDMGFHGAKEWDPYRIRTGNERYEIPEAVIFGG